MVDKVALGGGSLQPVQRRYVQPTQTYQNKDLQNVATDVSNLISGLAIQNKKEKEVRNSEDKIQLVSKAKQESQDIDNAMLNASYDDNLNKQVTKWRDANLTETQIRNEARNYKYDKAIEYWGLNSPDSEGTDEAQNAFFDVFTNLEDAKITPIAEADMNAVVKDVKDELNYNFMDGTDDYATKLKDAYTASDAYRNKIPEADIENMLIQTAVEKGDEALIADLKNSDGIPLIKTVEGKKVYQDAIEARTLKEANDEVRKQRELIKTQSINENNYYKNLIATPDNIESTMLQAKQDYLDDKLSFKQYTDLQKLQGVLQPSTSKFPETADPSVLAYLNTQASVGRLSQEELITYADFITQAQFQSISTKALTNGGAKGYGKEGYDIMEGEIKGFVKANSGLSLLEKADALTSSIDLAQARATTMTKYINTEVAKIIDETGKLPSQADLIRIKKEAKEEANIQDGVLDDLGNIANTITDATSYEELEGNLTQARKNNIDNLQWLKSLTATQRATYIAGRQAKLKQIQDNADGVIQKEDKLVKENQDKIQQDRQPTPLENTLNQLFKESNKNLPFLDPESPLGKLFSGNKDLSVDEVALAEDQFVQVTAGLNVDGLYNKLKNMLGFGKGNDEKSVRDLFNQVVSTEDIKTSGKLFADNLDYLEGTTEHTDVVGNKTTPYGVNREVHSDKIKKYAKDLGKTEDSLTQNDYKNIAMNIYEEGKNEIRTKSANKEVFKTLPETYKTLVSSIKFNTGQTFNNLILKLDKYNKDKSITNLEDVIKGTTRVATKNGNKVRLKGLDNRAVKELVMTGLVDLNNEEHKALVDKVLFKWDEKEL